MTSDAPIAYVTGRYPAITHTFIRREVQALRRLGVEVRCYSVWRAKDSELLSPADRDEAARTDALIPLRTSRLLRAQVRGLASAPTGYIRTLRRAIALSSPGIRRRSLAIARFLCALVLWDDCRQRGITHIHAQLDGTAPTIAMLAAEFGNGRSNGSPRWTWSHRIHGSKEFYDVHAEKLAERAASASFIACISDYTRSQVMAFVPEELWDRLCVVRCGVDLREFAPREHVEKGEPRILAVGRVDAMKGTVLLLHALARLRERGLDPRLTVVGDGPSRRKAAELAAELGIGDHVLWEGAVGEHRIRDLYAECDVFCLPSFAEGIPIVLMEAMAMEIPVVASAITGVPELVEDGVNGLLVRPGRIDLLTDALARLLEDPSLREAMGRAGRRRVADEYDLARNARELARLFQGGHRAPEGHGQSATVVSVGAG